MGFKFEKVALRDGRGWFKSVLVQIAKTLDAVIHEEELVRLVGEALVEIDKANDAVDPYTKVALVTDIVVDKVDQLTDFSKVKIKIGLFSVPGNMLEAVDGPVIRMLLEGVVMRLVLAEMARREAQSPG